MAAPHTTVRYVRVGGADAGNDCASAATPCATVQRAIDVAVSGDELHVAGGTYTGVQARETLTQHLYISQSVTIRGGYPADFSGPPDAALYPTTLDAAGLGRVVVVAPGNHATLDGLQLVNGEAGSQNGGGLFVSQASITLDDITFSSNRAEFGGGLYFVQGQLTIENCHFSQNTARLGGGAARLYGGTAVLSHNTFANNTAGLHGGALHVTTGQTTLQHNRLTGNTVTGGSQGWGGGLHLSNGQATLVGNLFSSNQAHTGGGLRLFQSQATLDANLFSDNQAAIGGGLSLENDSTAVFTNNVLLDNTAVTAAALNLVNTQVTLQHTTFAGNENGLVVNGGQAELVNTIIASQTTGIVNSAGLVTVTATLWDGVAQPVVGTVTQSGGLTGTAAFANDGYHLMAVSGAIDNGVNVGVMADVDGLPRPIGSSFDLGAVEWRDLAARKTVQPALAAPGDLVTYTIVLDGPATPGMMVWLTDTLPAEVTFSGPLTYTAGSGGHSSGVITWTGAISTDTAVTLTWPVQLHEDLLPGTQVANTAVIASSNGIVPSTTAVVTVPAKVYLPLVVRP
ncbi:MAG: hypothetical protein HND44_20180 [Chloroflexi bacterium]|nr:hypothetical protein [Ardenticatenaceae bacterium]MBL1130769.1 hypothetical protein [Chloroflexota bacterium]NOG36864.1 hypothetical protein [Chloroflexota bacterium]GIK57969.1 MAG: hypothetical protein BroJett015_36320 [Chloroflexota bacterium]